MKFIVDIKLADVVDYYFAPPSPPRKTNCRFDIAKLLPRVYEPVNLLPKNPITDRSHRKNVLPFLRMST